MRVTRSAFLFGTELQGWMRWWVFLSMLLIWLVVNSVQKFRFYFAFSSPSL